MNARTQLGQAIERIREACVELAGALGPGNGDDYDSAYDAADQIKSDGSLLEVLLEQIEIESEHHESEHNTDGSEAA